MCAIAGMIDLPFDSLLNEEMLISMHRRGPDQQGIYMDEGCCMLHARLSIIDPEGGTQPMTLTKGNRSYTIVYNGELYNTAEIKSALQKNGHTFLTNSDTEVVLRAYIQWNECALEQLNGIFAFAVWESSKRELFLARDRIGVKPLFYTQHRNGLIFASEIKTILCYPSVEPVLDEVGAAQILLLGPGRLQGSGVFNGINELKPGCYAKYSQGVLTQQQYWKLRDREHTQNFEDTAAYVKYLVTDAIERQMVSDMPLGTFLSGGLDSSIITSVCARKRAEEGELLDTFSVDYKNNDQYFVPGKFQPNSDNAYISLMRDTLKTRHHSTVLDAEELVNALRASTIARDLPGMADVDFSLLAFCGEIRQNVKVALSGECADEIFGGYPWYRDPDVRAREGFPWAQNTKYRTSFLRDDIRNKLNPEEFVMDQYRYTLAQSDILPGTDAENIRIKQMVNLNFQWFMQTLLDRKDRMSMYQSLEVRVPFCDHRIAEYLYGVPWEFKEYHGMEKGLLRYAMKDCLPEQILYRKKSPYPKTYDPKYLQLVSGMLRVLLADKNAPIFGIIPRKTLESLLSVEYEWPWYGQLMKVPQTIAYMLQIDFWLREYKIRLKI